MQTVQALNHVGFVVESNADERPYYDDTLGARFDGIEDLPDLKVRVAFSRTVDMPLELLEPTDPSWPVAKFLEKRGKGPHHPGFTVESIEDRICSS